MNRGTGKIIQNTETGSSNRWLDYTVWTVALWASILNLLNFNNYPLLRPEVGITLLGLAVLGCLLGAVQQIARPHLAFLVAALFISIAIDLNASIELGWFYAIWFGLAVIGFFALGPLLKITLAAFGAVFLFQLFGLIAGPADSISDHNEAKIRQTTNSVGSARPAIVHLVLDSHLGLDGLALGPDDYLDLRAEQVSFFTAQGFQLYPRAYSRHTRTTDSLPRMFSYGDDWPALHWINTRHSVPEELPYFSDLDKLGYRISAAVPAYFDLCVNQKLTHCRNWESSALTSMLGTELGAFDRAKVFAFTLLELADAPARVAAAIQFSANDLLGTEGRWPSNRSQLYHLASLKELERFIDELADLRRGEARFAHSLLPHSPFGLSANCSVKPEADWLNEHGPSAEADREKAYADQVRCLQQRIARMLDVLEQSEAGREAIVLIHGDHGSRIAPDHPSLDGPELSSRQMLMSHSTLFAMRVPGEPAQVVPGTHSLDELMTDFRDRDFASAPRPRNAPARVLITDSYRPGSEWRPLPGFGP